MKIISTEVLLLLIIILLYCNHTYAKWMFSDKQHQKEA